MPDLHNSMELFRVRLNCIDHYQSTPTQFDPQLRINSAYSDNQNEPNVPVIRVFGSTETGQKVCAHIHGAFPYLYVEYNGSLIPDEVGAYLHRLHLSIDHALGVTYRRNIYDGKSKFVARITLVKGIPFYGYHVGYRFYLKIYMLNPMVMTRLSDLLRQGVIMKKVFQPYEAHLQYLLQWMTDYNLYGCGYIDCRKSSFRYPVPRYDDLEDSSHLWHDRSIPDMYILQKVSLPRSSHCALEVDICVENILNRTEVTTRMIHHDFLERLNPLNPSEKFVHSMAGLWRDETRRRKLRMANPDQGSSPLSPEVMMSVSADPRNSQPGGWIHEEEYMEKVEDLILDEKNNSTADKPSFEAFVSKQPFEDHVRTLFESVEDLFPENLGPALGLRIKQELSDYEGIANPEEADVDENRIPHLSNDDDSNDYESDEDVMREIELSQRKKEDRVDHTASTVGGNDPSLANLGSSKPSVIETGGPHFHAAIGVTQTENLQDISQKKSDKSKPGTARLPITHSDSLEHEQNTNWRKGTESSHLIRAFESGIKRPSSGTDGLDKSNKRQRVKFEDTGSQKPLTRNLADKDLFISIPHSKDSSISQNAHTVMIEARTDDVISRTTLESPMAISKNYSRESLKSSAVLGSHAMGFSVAKNPQEPSTFIRSSQSSLPEENFSSSQNKQVSFDTDLPFRSQDAQLSDKLPSSTMTSEKLNSSGVLMTLNNIRSSFNISHKSQLFMYAEMPPNSVAVELSMQACGLPQMIYQDAYYSNETDVPDKAREWAGREFKLESLTIPFLPLFDPSASSAATFGEKQGIVLDRAKEEIMHQRRRGLCNIRSWQIGEPSPSIAEVLKWLQEDDFQMNRHNVEKFDNSYGNDSNGKIQKLSQIEGPTQNSKHEFKYTQKQTSKGVQYEAQYMSTMSLELHVNTRESLVPNPEEDEIQCVFWCLQSDEVRSNNGFVEGTQAGIVVLSEDGSIGTKISRQIEVEVQEETSELDLLLRIVELVRSNDPDILTGYEVHGGSWGYLIERARLKYDYNLCDELSRMKSQSHGRFGKESDKWGFNTTSTIRVTGRHMINIWRAMRSELNLLQYTMENVVFHLLQLRIPHYCWRDLTTWYLDGKLRDLAKVIEYFVSRVQLNLAILESSEIIPRTSEQARILGVDFFSVFSRGSQFKVESLMFRIAKPENFLLVSPSRKQVGGQNALECISLVMEPQSSFYNSPLLVLDFQSLYPSVMIAYNYCYSTFLGRVVNWRGTNKMGFTEYKRQERLLELLKDHINIAPNGMMYVKPEIRKSLLAKMLGEILETRVMVKSSMELDKDNKALQRLLNNRQLALKLIANVTYGYTSASFSGRMPCSEIADSIVQTGRETLEKAIALIHSVERWGAEVVYGDTDSLFVYLKGRSKDQAFDIGNEIVKTITNMNPRPVKLKFEKVYFPSVLLAKKRYVGFKYETKDQKEPDFDAKGIETVRRDGTPAEQKIEEKALKIFFRTADLSQVKSYFQSQCEKIMKGSVSVQDFCFAKEVKLGSYSDKGIPPPGALISTKRMLEDARAEPQYGERVPYVVITGAPGARLIDRCVAPETLLYSDHNELDAEYYISKNLIPPLERIFNLVGANVRNWYDEMPKVQRIRRVEAQVELLGPSNELPASRKTMESYMKSSSCLVCRDKLECEGAICASCLVNRPASLLTLHTRLSKAEKTFLELEKICQSCSGTSWSDPNKCDSKDCPVFYTRTRQGARLKTERALTEPIIKVLQGTEVTLDDLEW